MKTLSAATLIALISTSPVLATSLFTEDWDDTLGSTRWSAPIIALECAACGFDGSVDYAFDYSSIGAPSAPGSAGGTTTGIMMETNTTVDRDGFGNPVFQGEGVGVVPTGFNLPAGDFILTSDVYMFWNGGGGSTEYAGLGVFSGGTATPVRFNIDNGDGLAWQADTDGDSGTDLYRYEGAPNNVETGLGGYEAIPDGSIPGVVTGPSKIGPYNQWIELKIENIANIVSFSMNGYVIDTFDNSGGAFNGGTLLLNQSDPFDSVNADDIFGFSNVTVFDNINLSVPSASIVGDLDNDGFVGITDLNIVLGVWNTNVTPGDLLAGDPSGDGFVGIEDLNTVLGNWNAGTPPASSAVPEPATLALFGLGGLAMLKRRH